MNHLICLSASLKNRAMSFQGVVFLRIRLQFNTVSKFRVCFFNSIQLVMALFFMVVLTKKLNEIQLVCRINLSIGWVRRSAKINNILTAYQGSLWPPGFVRC